MAIPGIILAGGRSRRMGGGDKALRPLAGRPLIDHVIRRAQPQLGALALNANGGAERFAAFGLPVRPDPVPGWPGPLAGILAGLDWAADLGQPAVVTLACDGPFLPADLVARLVEAAGSGAAVAATETAEGRRLHPVYGMWPVTARPLLREALASGTRRVRDWAVAAGAAHAVFPEGEVDPFLNLNTPSDWAAAERLIAEGLAPP